MGAPAPIDHADPKDGGPQPWNKLVVIGVDTLIGCGLAAATERSLRVSGHLVRARRSGQMILPIPAGAPRRCHQLAAAIEEAEPDCLIYAGSLSASSWDLPAADPAWQQEAAMAEGLASAARRSSAKLIALSSDVVFSGPKMFHDEAAATTSAHPAAAAVLQWEQTLLAGGALVARTCAYGLGAGRRPAGPRRADRPGLACRAAGAGRWAAVCHADFRGRSGPAVAACCRSAI